ncbi:hypothetical protein [Neolewinella persica]|uniref:hypothetical protein n=1 Tax=Neolewinella persica TaxID=70998 RepID=UPI00037DCEA8|nr:hypothetical protein [Neolewinella persica]
MNSDKFIKYEEWEDYWFFKPVNQLKLEILEELNVSSWKPPKNGIKIRIETNLETNEPTGKQLEALEFVKQNQARIIESIYNFHQNIVFPLYNVSIDIEEDQIITKKEQTNLVYSIKSIQIPRFSTEQEIYFILNFNFNYDDEHDMSFLFKNLTVIDFAGLGDDFIDYKELYENRLEGSNESLTISVYDKPNSAPVFRAKYSIHEKIDFKFEEDVYTIGIYREKWPQSFKLFFYPKNLEIKYSLNDIIKLQ